MQYQPLSYSFREESVRMALHEVKLCLLGVSACVWLSNYLVRHIIIVCVCVRVYRRVVLARHALSTDLYQICSLNMKV